MKNPYFNRRRFFKLGAFGAGAVAAASLAGVATAPSQTARAAADAPRLALPQPTFNAVPSTTAFGPPTDIAAGWDGTLWATDASGAPHLYDPVGKQWNLHGEGIDAVALINGTYYWLKGTEFITAPKGGALNALQNIGTAWPNLPDSFKLGVSGAAGVNGKLFLFKGGWYLPVDGSQPRAKFIDIAGWPQTPDWKDGVIDAVFSSENTSDITLIRAREYVVVSGLDTPGQAKHKARFQSRASAIGRPPCRVNG